jgi:hypothetical protein
MPDDNSAPSHETETEEVGRIEHKHAVNVEGPPPITISDRPFVRPRPSRLRVQEKRTARTDERGRSRNRDHKPAHRPPVAGRWIASGSPETAGGLLL